jgi:hypothetical protein
MSNNCKDCDSIKCSYAKQPGVGCAMFWTVADKHQSAAVSPSNSSDLLCCPIRDLKCCPMCGGRAVMIFDSSTKQNITDGEQWQKSDVWWVKCADCQLSQYIIMRLRKKQPSIGTQGQYNASYKQTGPIKPLAAPPYCPRSA